MDGNEDKKWQKQKPTQTENENVKEWKGNKNGKEMKKKKKPLKNKVFQTMIRIMLPYFYILLLIGLMTISPIVTLIPMVFAQGTAGETRALSQEAIPILLSIQYGQSGAVQDYPINNGDAVFIQAGQASNPTLNVNPQEAKETDAYKEQVGTLSAQVSQNISKIRQKQHEVETEVYTVYKTPLVIEKTNLENDLQVLEKRREQLTSQRTAKEALKPTIPPVPPPKVATGFTVKTTINGARVSLTIQAQGPGATQTTIQAALGTWVQIFSAEKGPGQDIWAKVTPRTNR